MSSVIAANRSSEATLSTIAFRVAAMAVAAFMIAAVAIMFFLSYDTDRVLTRQVLEELTGDIKLLRAKVDSDGLRGLKNEIELRSQVRGRDLYILFDGRGQKIAGNLSQVPPEFGQKNSDSGGLFYYTPSLNKPDQQRLAVGVHLNVDGGGLIVARDVEDQRALSIRTRWIALGGFGLLGLIGVVAGWWISRFVLGQVDRITKASRAIMAGNLSERVPRSGSGDEFDRLSASLNEMLTRIEQLMHGLREVSDNIAHDLKTPLNRLRVRAEAALRDPRGSEAYKEGLEHTIESADELIKTFNALLLIARLEAGAFEETLEEVDVVCLVQDVVELYEPVAEVSDLQLKLIAPSPVVIPVNKQLVGQAVANLIDNAIKYSRGLSKDVPKDGSGNSASSVSVQVQNLPHDVIISVADRGPGISCEDRKRVLKRFVRLEKSRTAPGTGLGLSLVAAVARLHGGTIELADNEPGLKVIITLPKRPSDKRE